MKRNQKIVELRKQKWKLQEIALPMKITQERVRQVISEEEKKFKFCKLHKKKYTERICPTCKRVKWLIKIVRYVLKEKGFDSFKVLDLHNRQKDIVLQRMILIKELVNRYNFSFNTIARFFIHRDHTSIINLYNKKI